MSQVRTRENTFKVDLSNFPKRPSIEELQKFVLVNLGLAVGQVKRFQVNHAQNCAHVKCVDLKTAQDTVAKHDGKHEIEVNKTKVKVRLVMEDGGVEVKIHDLSENVSSDEIVAFLRNYGDVLNIREVPWGESFPLRGMPSGIRVAKMVLRRHIKSFVSIQSEQTLISYRGQPQTCKHCTLIQHVGISCVENKKLVNQKADLNARLDKVRGSTSTSYASVLNTSASTTNTLLPEFSSTSLGPMVPKRSPPIVAESTVSNTSTSISGDTTSSVQTDVLTNESVTELSAGPAADTSAGGELILCPNESDHSAMPTEVASTSGTVVPSPLPSAAPAVPEKAVDDEEMEKENPTAAEVAAELSTHEKRLPCDEDAEMVDEDALSDTTSTTALVSTFKLPLPVPDLKKAHSLSSVSDGSESEHSERSKSQESFTEVKKKRRPGRPKKPKIH